MDNQRQEEFVRLLTQAQPALRGFIHMLSGSFGEVEDVMQEVSVVVWQKFESFDRSQNFLPWAMGIARNIILKSRRDYARHPLCVDSGLVQSIAERYVELAPEMDARQSRLQGCLEKLSDQHREILRLRYEQDLSPKSIGERFARSEAALQTMLSRIRAVLESCVEQTHRREQSYVA